MKTQLRYEHMVANITSLPGGHHNCWRIKVVNTSRISSTLHRDGVVEDFTVFTDNPARYVKDNDHDILLRRCSKVIVNGVETIL